MQSGWPSLTRLSEGISAALLPPNCPASALVTCFQMISLPELDRKKQTHTPLLQIPTWPNAPQMAL